MPRPKKAATVEPAEYTDEVAPQVKTEESASKAVETEVAERPDNESWEGWEAGRPAPATKYRNLETGKIVDKQPVRAEVVVNKGDEITLYIKHQLGH